MAQTHQHLKHAPFPIGDMGIGLCFQCVLDMQTNHGEGQPAFGITLAPMMVPIPGPTGAIVGVAVAAVPACWEHLSGAQEAAQEAAQRSPLIVAQGSVPRAPGQG